MKKRGGRKTEVKVRNGGYLESNLWNNKICSCYCCWFFFFSSLLIKKSKGCNTLLNFFTFSYLKKDHYLFFLILFIICRNIVSSIFFCKNNWRSRGSRGGGFGDENGWIQKLVFCLFQFINLRQAGLMASTLF